uniref:Uncharacterized protein n=1 Tax=Candidatus Kentrum sp. LPFa TaxID=2126335 RepID=A0A450XAF4_9GAMM|nr:MAG: hypothetical protein BECKLPF1236C_GA0070990_100242 [Candidatus Kentron sp. LPFa]VFK26317.1 MAG: hypothetical protein BECKLPF1236A_GA0070988_105231 [Candidatus Kentron sp. LPFa]
MYLSRSPWKNYEVLTEMMEDYEDMLDLRAAKEQAKGQKGIPLDQAIADLGIEHVSASRQRFKGGWALISRPGSSEFLFFRYPTRPSRNQKGCRKRVWLGARFAGPQPPLFKIS